MTVIDCICPDPRLTLGENADVRYPVEFDPACPLHRPPAPELSPAEAAIVARFDAAPVPPEVQVETVARALADAARESQMADDVSEGGWRVLADAAIAAMPPSEAAK